MRTLRLMRLLALLVGLVLIAGSRQAIGLEVPKLTGHINDLAGMLSPSTVQQLEGSLAAFADQDSTQIVVLTIPSLDGEALENYSLRVAEQWQLGQKDLDNGALLLVAKNDRKIRIEVGYGLEGQLTDLIAGRIIRDIIGPQFRNGNFDQGIIDGVSAIMATVKGEFTASPDPAAGSSNSDPEGMLVMLIFAMLFLGRVFSRHKVLAAGVGGIVAPIIGFISLGAKWLILFALIPIGAVAGLIAALAGGSSIGRHSGRGSGWSSGSFGSSSGSFGGGFSGGGGGFGGGGASGGW